MEPQNLWHWSIVVLLSGLHRMSWTRSRKLQRLVSSPEPKTSRLGHNFQRLDLDLGLNGLVYIPTLLGYASTEKTYDMFCSRSILFFSMYSGASIPMGQGGHVPQYLDWGDMITNVPPIFLE